jgi:hypothetical protein
MGVEVGSGVKVGVGGIGVKKDPGTTVAVGRCTPGVKGVDIGVGAGVSTALQAVSKRINHTEISFAFTYIYFITSSCLYFTNPDYTMN